MMRKDTLYETLEVSSGASASVIRAAYRSLAQLNHPDKNPDVDAACEALMQINHAYSVLSDSEKRRRYDQTLEIRERGGDRRGSAMAKGGDIGPTVANPPVSRPFAFRPLT